MHRYLVISEDGTFIFSDSPPSSEEIKCCESGILDWIDLDNGTRCIGQDIWKPIAVEETHQAKTTVKFVVGMNYSLDIHEEYVTFDKPVSNAELDEYLRELIMQNSDSFWRIMDSDSESETQEEDE